MSILYTHNINTTQECDYYYTKAYIPPKLLYIYLMFMYLYLFLSFSFFWFDFDGCWSPIYNHTLFIFSLLSFIHLSFALSLPPVLKEKQNNSTKGIYVFLLLFSVALFWLKHASYSISLHKIHLFIQYNFSIILTRMCIFMHHMSSVLQYTIRI